MGMSGFVVKTCSGFKAFLGSESIVRKFLTCFAGAAWVVGSQLFL